MESDLGKGRQPVNGVSPSQLPLRTAGAQFHQGPLGAAESILFGVAPLGGGAGIFIHYLCHRSLRTLIAPRDVNSLELLAVLPPSKLTGGYYGLDTNSIRHRVLVNIY